MTLTGHGRTMTQETPIDLGEDIAQQERVWRIERISWVLMALALAASLLGFTGHGYFSERMSGSSESGLVVTYHRFERYAAPTLFTVRLMEAPSATTRLRVGQDFMRNVEVLRVDPQPQGVELGADFLTYVFATSAAGTIVFHYEPAVTGTLAIEIGLEGRPLLASAQFVYP